ncbi:MAG: MBL fold metallo-hydrolase [Desulfobaccales bacterium]
MKAKLSEVRIRMYRLNGLGDCFLLQFKARDGSSRWMLIDCGVFMRTQDGSTRLQKIAADIKQTTNNNLDILVVTHEHWDHLSGFFYAQEIFKQIHVGQVWFGWTEDPGDKRAQALREHRHFMVNELSNLAMNLTGLNEARSTAINELMLFNGPMQAAPSLGSTAAIMEFLRAKGEACYLCPDHQPFSLDGLEGLRFYVLGPPTKEDFLRKSEPATGEVYGMTADMKLSAADAALMIGLSSEPGSGAPISTLTANPFDRSEVVPITEAGKFSEFRAYLDGPAWRKIDDLTFNSVDTLSLKLDDDTNNTSLVLALELVESGKVLLFPGDAQVGSWQSWQDLEWTLEGEADKKVRAWDLLERTVFYKVGHHGSHNATLRTQGLELMISQDLVAMIPVHEEQARGKGWKMPDPSLYERLQEKTAGRLLRMDQDTSGFPANLPSKLEADTSEEKLWIEYSIEC